MKIPFAQRTARLRPPGSVGVIAATLLAGAVIGGWAMSTLSTTSAAPVGDLSAFETKEQLGGSYIVDVPDLDAAISWATRCPAASHRRCRSPADLARVDQSCDAARDDQQARGTAEAVARRSYGKLVAFLAARTRDVTAAEDALSDAFAAALVDWPVRGIPTSPEAWLIDGGAAQADRCCPTAAQRRGCCGSSAAGGRGTGGRGGKQAADS